MSDEDTRRRTAFRSAEEDLSESHAARETPQTASPAYRLAFDDPDFLTRDALRPVRLQLELPKPELAMSERGIVSTIVLFGGARVPAPDSDAPEDSTPERRALAHWYDEARAFARLCSDASRAADGREHVVVTGGGPGVMEAGARGAADAGAASIGLNIVLPHEQAPNAWVTPELCFNFHYFAIRKMHFLLRARAVAVFPGGFGTLDELFETLTLIQTGRMARIPVLLFGEAYWREIVNFEALAKTGTIARADLDLFSFVETAKDAWTRIAPTD